MIGAFALFVALSFSLVVSSASTDRAPALREWQAKRIMYSFAIQQQRPGFVVVKAARVSKYKFRLRANEPGYLFPEDGPDVTLNFVERRGYSFWIWDDLSQTWKRWL